MSFRNSITIVASPRQRVGKTLLARVLTDFYLQEGRSVAGFDLNAGDATFSDFMPGHATPAKIGDIKGQMALFDRLIAGDETSKIVDLGHESFESFFALAHRIGFAEEARKRGFAPAILFVLTPERATVDVYRGLRNRFPQATLAPVHNEMLGSAQHRDKYDLLGSGEVVVHVPMLAPVWRKHIEHPPFSFADSTLAASRDIPADVNVELQRWLRKVFLEFRELDLRVMLADLKSSIRLES